jgi:serine/threonine-protein kinase
MTLAPGTQLGPYEIVSQLGSGGMGVVYEAKDPRLKRTVAIKLLPPDLTKDDTAKQRFLQEAQAASALDHPNICTIFEINETDDGQLYLVMAHYEGETLKERIARGPLVLDDALDIATQVGQGLAEAHGAGIVHRDIKPANLLVTKTGVVKILDFGLAKLAGSEGVTQTGTTVGTVAYMSPEQARGQEVDHRADIWSLGVVLYEMLAGTPPFQGENLLSLADAIRSSDPEPVSGESSSLNPTLSRAMNKDVGQRYQTVAELLSDLRTPQSGSDPATVATPAQADVPSIAVLPFVNMSADPEQEYFCDGLAEELIDALARLKGLRVVARTSAFQFKGQAPDLRQVGEQLNVKTVLVGSVRKAGHRLRINTQLINTTDGYHLWSDRYDRDMDDIFLVQDEMASAIVSELKVRLLAGEEARLIRPSTVDVEAYHLYLKGRHRLNIRTEEALNHAVVLFEDAIARDPGYAGAYAGLADGLMLLGPAGYGSKYVDVLARARTAALKAIELDDQLAEAHEALGFLRFRVDWDWTDAERELRRAIELNAGSASAHHRLALTLIAQGRSGDAVGAISRAIELDPLALVYNTAKGRILSFARRHEEAIVQLRHTLELDSNFTQVHFDLGASYAYTGRFDEAIAEFEKGLTLAGRRTLMVSVLGHIYGVAGRRSEAQAVLEELQKLAQTRDVPAFYFALVHVGLGDMSAALAALEHAYEQRTGAMVYLSVEPDWDTLRSDPRFQALLQRMNFPTPASPDAPTGA